MITRKQLKIFEEFVKQPFATLTRNEVKKLSKEKSNNLLARTINQLKTEEVIRENKVGKTGMLTINLSNNITYAYIALANAQRISPQIKKIIALVEAALNKAVPFHCLVIFGSYAVQAQKNTSDLDIAVIIENLQNKEKTQAVMNTVVQQSLIKIDAFVIAKEELIEMLVNDEENLGKQIARKHVSVNNHQILYELIKEGIKHGFRI